MRSSLACDRWKEKIPSNNSIFVLSSHGLPRELTPSRGFLNNDSCGYLSLECQSSRIAKLLCLKHVAAIAVELYFYQRKNRSDVTWLRSLSLICPYTSCSIYVNVIIRSMIMHALDRQGYIPKDRRASNVVEYEMSSNESASSCIHFSSKVTQYILC